MSAGFFDLLHKSATRCSPYGSMSTKSPYLQRRGDSFSFRIAVPSELRSIIGKREFVQTLQTTDKRIAVVKALMLAATAKQLFNELNGNMTDSKNSKLMELLREKKHKMQLDERDEQHEDKLIAIRLLHNKELKQVKLEAQNEAFKQALTSSPALTGGSPASPVKEAPEALKTTARPTSITKKPVLHKLSEIIPIWKRLKNPAISTVEIYEAAIARFESHFPELYAESIEKRHTREYVAWLESQKLVRRASEKNTVQLEHFLPLPSTKSGWAQIRQREYCYRL